MLARLCILSVAFSTLSSAARYWRKKDEEHSSAFPHPSGRTCEDVWNDPACKGQFGNEVCYSCGARIDWLVNEMNWSFEVASQHIADEFLSVCGPCGSAPPPVIETEGYKLVWSDEFDGSRATMSQKWYHEDAGWGFGNNELQWYTLSDENSWVSNGTLKIKAMKQRFNGRDYTSAKVYTKQDWKYAKITVRAKMSTCRGTWAAIWMMPTQRLYGGWPRSGEIDIMENVGYDPDVVHGTVHTQAYHHSIGTEIGGKTYGKVAEWAEYTMEWRPDVILFAMNGQVYQLFRNKMNGNTDQWPFDQKFHLILNMAVGGNWGGIKGIDDVGFGQGQFLEVDYVRVEQREV